jgi:hypothetical protein
MLKQLVIPFFVLSIAAVGCGSSSSGTPDGSAGHVGTAGTTGTAGATAGTTGTAGATAGTTGTAGATAGTTGTAGATAGTTGTAGTGADAAAGTGADAAAGTGVDAGHDAVIDSGADTGSSTATAEALCPAKRTATNAAVPYSAADFCAAYLDICSANLGAITAANCEATYTAFAGKTITAGGTDLQSCVSYHLCNAQTMDKGTHCPHAQGLGACAH